MFDTANWIIGIIVGLCLIFGNGSLVLSIKSFKERKQHPLDDDDGLLAFIALATTVCTGVFTATCISRTMEELAKADPSLHGKLLVIAVCALAGARYGSYAASNLIEEVETELHHDEELCDE